MEGAKSFYSLDYIIDIGEKRMEQYSAAYQLTLGRMTNIILVYSAVGIYLIPIIQDFAGATSTLFKMATILLMVMLGSSLYYAIRLLIPANIAYLKISSVYYQDLRVQYEQKIFKQNMSEQQRKEAKQMINDFIKTSYIDELAWGQLNNRNILKRKSSFYHRALVCGLLSILPYIVCVSYHISDRKTAAGKKGMTTEKIVNLKNITESKMKTSKPGKMADAKENGQDNPNTEDRVVTQVPGIDSSQVIPSQPYWFKESSSKLQKKRPYTDYEKMR